MARNGGDPNESHTVAGRGLVHGSATPPPATPPRGHRAALSRSAVPRALVIAALAYLGAAPSRAQSGVPSGAAHTPKTLLHEPREWLPRDETLNFKVEVTVGPVRGLDVGSVRLTCKQTPEPAVATEDAAATLVERPRLIASIDGLARAMYLGRRLNHTIAVRWYEGSQPRVDYREYLRGSRSSTCELRVGEFDSQWKLEYRKDRHCKGCNEPAHFTKGFLPWSKLSHCEDCDLPEHRVWRDYTYLEVPSDALDIVSALYFARGFLSGAADSTAIALVNHDKLWDVRLKRGNRRKVKTSAGEFDCVAVLIGPRLTAGDSPGKQANERFEALFGLHGDIEVWVDRERGFPVVIEGTAPIGPFDLHVKASLTSHEGG